MFLWHRTKPVFNAVSWLYYFILGVLPASSIIDRGGASFILMGLLWATGWFLVFCWLHSESINRVGEKK